MKTARPRSKFLSLLLTLCMVVTMLPAAGITALAAPPSGNWLDTDSSGKYIYTDMSPFSSSITNNGQTEATAYKISTAEQLAGFAALLNNTGTAIKDKNGGSYKMDHSFIYAALTADIDLSAHSWTPAGGITDDAIDNRSYFTGFFDGGSKTVSGMAIDEQLLEGHIVNPYYYVGLFGSCAANIKNLSVKGDISVYCSGVNHTVRAGLISGLQQNGLTGCSGEGSVYIYGTTKRSLFAAAGGLIGEYRPNDSDIACSGCSFTCTDRSGVDGSQGDSFAGGIAGIIDSTCEGVGFFGLSVENCTVSAKSGASDAILKATSPSSLNAFDSCAGGIAGAVYGENNVITGCRNLSLPVYARVVYTAPEAINRSCYSGGIVGNMYSSSGNKVTGCANSATISAIGGKIGCAGGIAGLGRAGGTSASEACTNSGRVTAESSTSANAGGIAGRCGCYGDSSYKFPVINCENTGTVAVLSQYGTAGGIAGSCLGTKGVYSEYISECKNSGPVGGYGLAFGGIAGEIQGLTMTRCSNTAAVKITAPEEGTRAAGGIAGVARGNSKIVNCSSTGDVTSDTNHVTFTNAGGILGTFGDNDPDTSDTFTAENCYSQGKITAGEIAGGLVGGTLKLSSGAVSESNRDKLNLKNCYASGAVDAAIKGGLIGSNDGFVTLTANGCYRNDPSIYSIKYGCTLTETDCGLFSGFGSPLDPATIKGKTSLLDALNVYSTVLGDLEWAQEAGKYPVFKVTSGDTATWQQDGHYDTSWYVPGGTEFTLTTPAQFAGFSHLLFSGNDFAGVTLKLANDIDISKYMWAGSGGSLLAKNFAGILDGQGHNITGLRNEPVNLWSLLTGIAPDGIVENIRLYGNISGADSGQSMNTSFATYCDGTLRGCSFDGTITGAALCGLVMQLGGTAEKPAVIENCSVSGTLSSRPGDDVALFPSFAIGIAGTAGNALSGGSARGTARISNCYCTANIIATASEAGKFQFTAATGILGISSFSDVQIDNCYFAGALSATGSTAVNLKCGIFGAEDDKSAVKITNSSWLASAAADAAGHATSLAPFITTVGIPTLTGCASFADNAGALTPAPAPNTGAPAAPVLLPALNAVASMAGHDTYSPWKVQSDSNGGYPVFGTSISFTVGSAPATTANALGVKDSPVYGDTWASIISKTGAVTATVGTSTDSDQSHFTLSVTGTPDAGSAQPFKLLYNGTLGGQKFVNTVVCSGTVDVAPRQVQITWAGTSGRVYGDGGSVTAAIANKVGSDDVSLTVTGGSETNAGTYTASAALAGARSANYVLPEVSSVSYTIAKAVPSGVPDFTRITSAGKTLADAALSAGSITPAGGTITWDAGASTPAAADKSYTWTYTPADTANYAVLTGSITPYPTVTFTLTFSTDGGSAVASLSRLSGTTVDISAYTSAKSGYTFAGWYSDAALTSPVTSVTLMGNTTVYAKWTADTGSVTSPKTGDSGKPAPWAPILLVTLAGAAGVFVFIRRRRREDRA